jgi:hypothetical protein
MTGVVVDVVADVVVEVVAGTRDNCELSSKPRTGVVNSKDVVCTMGGVPGMLV